MKNITRTIVVVLLSIFVGTIISSAIFAVDEANMAFSVAPMNQRISLEPGETYYGTFKITNPATSAYEFYYKASVSPFRVSEEYEPKFENNGDYNQIVDWIHVENDTGVIRPNETIVVRFTIEVPSNAPAGGQYAAIKITSAKEDETNEGINIDVDYEIAHIVYAEVAGETVRKGEVNSVSVPSFLFSGKIYGTSTIKNIGNVHSDASYTLQVFPVFSNEEIYTNEENPSTKIILPDTTRTVTTAWDQTPSIGIFHVIYNVEFEGVNQKVDKMVIVCPFWLLFIIAVIIFLIIFKILSGKKEKNKTIYEK